jgi:hypothetical protein
VVYLVTGDRIDVLALQASPSATPLSRAASVPG